jgi:hypothetical protein
MKPAGSLKTFKNWELEVILTNFGARRHVIALYSIVLTFSPPLIWALVLQNQEVLVSVGQLQEIPDNYQGGS